MKSIEEEAQQLTSDLFGDSAPGVSSGEGPDLSGKYQLPVKHNVSGAIIDEKNKPSILSTHIPKPFYREVHKKFKPHYGIDLQAPKGSPVYPMSPGVVTKTNSADTYVPPIEGRPASGTIGGKNVYISHEDGRVTSYYAHLDSVRVSIGDRLEFNTVIGTVGTTGNAVGTSPHLHWEVKVDGKRWDPQRVTGREIGSLEKEAQFIKGLIKKLNSYLYPNHVRSRISKLKEISKDAKIKAFEDQKYSDNSGEWNVPDIVDYATENGKKMSFSIGDLAKIAFQPSEDEEFDEVPGSPEFIERAMKTDLKYPITVVRYDDGDFIADGNHRLWKARELGQKKIIGYLIQSDDLKKIPVA